MRALQLHRNRAVIAILEVPIGAGAAADKAIAGALADTGVEAEQVVQQQVQLDEASRARLQTLNRERDLLLRERRAVLLVVPDAPSLRLLRETAPDLTAATDLWVEIPSPASHRSWESLAAAIRSLMQARHGSLDFTGLLPGTVEKRVVPMEELYIDLLKLDPPSLGPQDPAVSSWAPGTEERPLAWLLLADPGAGKTTALRYLASIYAGGRTDPLGLGGPVPLLIPLADLAAARQQDRIQSLVEYLPGWLAAQGISGAGALSGHLDEVLLLLDGLDEMREPAARRAVMDEVAGLAEQGRVAGVMVTGRSFLVDELRSLLPRFQPASCRAPAPGEIEAYLRRFISFRGAADPPRTATELARAIQADPDLRDLVRAPLLLLFLALLHELEGRLPDRRVEIYNRLAELLVERWVRARSLSPATPGRGSRTATRGEAWRVLGPLAWWVLERGGSAVPEAALEHKLVEIEARREEIEEAERRVRDLLILLQHDSALLRPEPGKRWAFVHPSVAEFFAGRDAERDPERWAALVADPFRPEWREIVLFAAGVVGVERGATSRLDELVESVLRGARRRGRYEARHPSLLVGLLREDPLLSSNQKRALLARLGEFWFQNAFAPTAARAVQQEAVAFLEWGARSPLREPIATELRRWFRPDPAPEIRWDRIAGASHLVKDSAFMSNLSLQWWMQVGEGWSAAMRRDLARLAAGPLVSALPSLLSVYGIDPEPLRTFLATQPDSRLRGVASF